MQNAKLRCCAQTTDRKGLSFSDILDQCSLLFATAKLDMKDDQVRSILKVKMYTLLLGDMSRIVVTFTDDKIQEIGFLTIILNATRSVKSKNLSLLEHI